MFLAPGERVPPLSVRFYLNLDGHKEFGHQISSSRLANILGNLYHAGILSFGFATGILKLLNKSILKDSTSDPLQSMLLVRSLKGKEHGLIVHLIRDPKRFVPSFMNWKINSAKRTILHHLIPFWQPNQFNHGNKSILNYISSSKFEQFCWIWNYKNDLFGQLSSQKNYLKVRLEDLMAEDEKTIKLFSDHLSLDEESFKRSLNKYCNIEVNTSSVSKFPKYENWDENKKKILDMHCRDLMTQFGYE